jgi:hypothetical protein
MKYVFVVNHGYEYEGQGTEAVFSTLKAARKYHPKYGDSKHILKVVLDRESNNAQDVPLDPVKRTKARA